MAGRPRRVLSYSARVGISLGVVGIALIAGLVAAVNAYFTPAQSSRFQRSESSPTCVVKGDLVAIHYAIGRADAPYDPDNDFVWVRPDSQVGLSYVDATTSPASPSNAGEDRGPGRYDLKLSAGTTIDMTFKSTARVGTLNGLRLNWANGEIAQTQLLPLIVKVSPSGCTIR